MYPDEDVKCARSTTECHNILHLLSFPVSMAIDSILDEFPKGFDIVIQESSRKV